MDVRTERLYALTSARVSALDGIPNATLGPNTAAFGMTFADLLHRLGNRITSPSALLSTGGSTAAVALRGHSGGHGVPEVTGFLHGMPFYLTAIGSLSATPLASMVSLMSTAIRRILVTLAFNSALPLSTLSPTGGTIQFTYGATFRTTGSSVLTGSDSAAFVSAELPKPSANEIALGWINLHNSFPASGAITTSNLYVDYRATQGWNLSAIFA